MPHFAQEGSRTWQIIQMTQFYLQMSGWWVSVWHVCWICTCSKPAAQLAGAFEIIYGTKSIFDTSLPWRSTGVLVTLTRLNKPCLFEESVFEQTTKRCTFKYLQRWHLLSSASSTLQLHKKGSWVALKCKQALGCLYVLRLVSGLELFSFLSVSYHM